MYVNSFVLNLSFTTPATQSAGLHKLELNKVPEVGWLSG